VYFLARLSVILLLKKARKFNGDQKESFLYKLKIYQRARRMTLICHIYFQLVNIDSCSDHAMHVICANFSTAQDGGCAKVVLGKIYKLER
jgi:hypothetical protein